MPFKVWEALPVSTLPGKFKSHVDSWIPPPELLISSAWVHPGPWVLPQSSHPPPQFCLMLARILKWTPMCGSGLFLLITSIAHKKSWLGAEATHGRMTTGLLTCSLLSFVARWPVWRQADPGRSDCNDQRWGSQCRTKGASHWLSQVSDLLTRAPSGGCAILRPHSAEEGLPMGHFRAETQADPITLKVLLTLTSNVNHQAL